MTIARLGYEIDSSGAVTAAGNLDRMTSAAGRAEVAQNVLSTSSRSAAGKMIDLSAAAKTAVAQIHRGQQTASIASASFSGLGAEISATARESQILSREMNEIRARFNPLFAASQRYEQELRDIAEAERLGAISATEAAAARERAASSLVVATPQVNTFSKSIKSSSAHVANLGAQFNDIGVMLAAGQSPLQLAVQQGTQINQVFAQLGGGREAIRAVGQGIASMVSPLSLATIGVIALGTAAGQWIIEAIRGADEAEEFADVLDRVESVSSGASDSLDILSATLSELTEDYGIGAQAAREWALAQAELRLGMAESQLRDNLVIVRDTTSAYVAAVDAGRNYRNTLLRIQDDFKLTSKEAKVFEGQLEALQGASNFEDQQKALEDIVSTLEAAGVPLGKIPGDFQRAIDELITLQLETSKAQNLMSQLAAAAAGVSVGGRGSVVPSSTDILLAGRGGEFVGDDDESGRRRGGARRDRFADDLERLRESLRTESEVVSEWYAQQQEILNNQRAMEILGAEQHNMLLERLEEEHLERMSKIRDGSNGFGIKQLGDFFSESASLMQSGNNTLFKIGKAAALANAVVNGHSAAVAAWEKGMQAGGPPVAAAFTALSLARTSAQIAAIRSASANGGGGVGAGGGTPAGITAEAPQAPQQTRAIIQLQGLGSRTRFTVDELNEIIEGIQEASDDGVIIEGVTR